MAFKCCVCYIIIVVLCHQVSSVPLQTSELPNGLVKKALTSLNDSGVSEGKKCFQAPLQIFQFQLCPPIERPHIPNDYVVVQKIGAYKLHTYAVRWNDARKICIKEGAYLAVFRSFEEMEFIKEFNTHRNIYSGWYGVHDLFSKDEWVTVLDEPLNCNTNYMPWIRGEPNNAGGNERCVAFKLSNGKYGMNDDSCDQLKSFYCKIDLSYQR